MRNIPFQELAKRYPKHLQALSHPNMQECARMVRIYTRITGERPPHTNDAIAFIAKRNAIAEWKREQRNARRDHAKTLLEALTRLESASTAAAVIIGNMRPDGQIAYDLNEAIQCARRALEIANT